MKRFRTTPLGEVADVFNGKTPARTEQRDAGHPVLKIKDVDESGNFRGKFESFVDTVFAQTHSKRKLNVADVLILNAAHNANYVASKVFFVDEQVSGAVATGEWTIIRANSSFLLPGFVYHWIRSQIGRTSIKNLVRGIHLYPTDVASVRLTVPPLEEQERIVKVLDEADELLKLRAQADRRTAALAPALFHEMFGDPRCNANKWRVEALGETLKVLHRYPTFYGTSYVEDGVPVARIGNILPSNMLDTDLLSYVRVPRDFSAKFPKTVLKSGDLVMAVRGDTTGKIGFVPSNLEGANISPNLIRISPDTSKVTSEYLLWLLLLVPTLVTSKVTDTAKKSITAENIGAIKIPVPSLQLQKEFAIRVSEICGLEAKQATSRRLMDALFQSLLYQAFQGDL